MIDRRDIVSVLRLMKEECVSCEGCAECRVAMTCDMPSNRIPSEWTDEEIEEIVDD